MWEVRRWRREGLLTLLLRLPGCPVLCALEEQKERRVRDSSVTYSFCGASRERERDPTSAPPAYPRMERREPERRREENREVGKTFFLVLVLVVVVLECCATDWSNDEMT
jgi:hypothetical protein